MTVPRPWLVLMVAALALVPTLRLLAADEPPSSRWQTINTRARVMSIAFEGHDVWLGLFGGVMRHDLRTERDFDLYTPANTGGQLLSTGVYTIEVDRDGDKWVGTYGGGLAKFDGSRWTTYSPYGWGSPADYRNTWTAYAPGRGLGDLWVYDVAFDRRGRMWVATWKGVSLFDGRGFTTYSVDEGLVDKWVYAIAIDRANVMWFGTEGGVTRFDGSTWKSYTHADGLGLETEQVVKNPDYTFGNPHHIDPSKQATASNPNYVISAAVDRRDHKWFGTWGGGISRFDGSSWTTYSKADGLGGNFVFSQAVDHHGVLWAGTDGGVSWFDGTRWRTYTTRDGLIDNFVYSIGVDDEGNKWFGTRVGVSRFADPDRTPLRSLFHRLGLSR
ncbi:MAG: hypothetical protein A2638_06100 [Nitrospirae bacterium RIFCSPHIGHO2_01_FULL_66_17]|nr:MAG: hypothetical protein A2638_06100 [Nitrospirae bacterium RIFCSPHIGHO2_01_FULL_66_17]